MKLYYYYSGNQENYRGDFPTVQSACAAALADPEIGETYWVGQAWKPAPPECLWRACMWLETVSVSEEYSLECAEGWDRSTLLQRDELESEVAPILAAWLDRHKLRPKFFVVKYPNEFRRDGKGGAE